MEGQTTIRNRIDNFRIAYPTNKLRLHQQRVKTWIGIQPSSRDRPIFVYDIREATSCHSQSCPELASCARNLGRRNVTHFRIRLRHLAKHTLTSDWLCLIQRQQAWLGLQHIAKPEVSSPVSRPVSLTVSPWRGLYGYGAQQGRGRGKSLCWRVSLFFCHPRLLSSSHPSFPRLRCLSIVQG